jgi:hypothetical protein
LDAGYKKADAKHSSGYCQAKTLIFAPETLSPFCTLPITVSARVIALYSEKVRLSGATILNNKGEFVISRA